MKYHLWNTVKSRDQDSRAIHFPLSLYFLWIYAKPSWRLTVGVWMAKGLPAGFPSVGGFAPVHPHFVTWALRDPQTTSEGQLAGVRGHETEGNNSLSPRERKVHSRIVSVLKELMSENGATRKDPGEHLCFTWNWGPDFSEPKLP